MELLEFLVVPKSFKLFPWSYHGFTTSSDGVLLCSVVISAPELFCIVFWIRCLSYVARHYSNRWTSKILQWTPRSIGGPQKILIDDAKAMEEKVCLQVVQDGIT